MWSGLNSYLFPVGPARLRARHQPRDGVALVLLVDEVERDVQSDRLHVAGRERRGHVEVDVEEAAGGGDGGLLELDGGQQADEPLERPLLTVDPEEVHLEAICWKEVTFI